MLFYDTQIMELVGEYFLPFVRLSAFFMAAPIFGTRLVSLRVRVVLGAVVTAAIVPIIPSSFIVTDVNFALLMAVTQQVLIGLSLGFTLQIVFQIFILSGQFIAMKMGLGFASMNDPANGVSVTIVSQLYLLTTTLLFLSINGHLILIQLLIDSFSHIPVGEEGLLAVNYYSIAVLGSWMFSSALSIALPVLTALLLVNIAFGVMSRSAPQMNIFAVGFPITLIFGIFIIWVGFSEFLNNFQQFIQQGLRFSSDLLTR